MKKHSQSVCQTLKKAIGITLNIRKQLIDCKLTECGIYDTGNENKIHRILIVKKYYQFREA